MAYIYFKIIHGVFRAYSYFYTQKKLLANTLGTIRGADYQILFGQMQGMSPTHCIIAPASEIYFEKSLVLLFTLNVLP